MRFTRVLNAVGKFLLAAGCLLLAFVAYQIWGTAVFEHHAQGQLLQQLRHRLETPVARIPHTPAASHANSATSSNVLANQVAPALADPAVGTPVGVLSIPKIGLTDMAVVEGTGEHQLQEGPGHYPGTPLPGEAGNVGIAGHRTTYAAPFYSLDALQPGDLIYVQTTQGVFSYQVSSSSVVSPSDTAVLAPTAQPSLTLTTCNPRFSASSRLVVTALLRTGVMTTSSAVSSVVPPRQPKLPTTLAGEATTPTDSTNAAQEAIRGALWGALALGMLALVRIGWRRLGHGWRWAPVVLGIPLALGLLFVCFQHVSLSLPETF
jgi:sortase A